MQVHQAFFWLCGSSRASWLQIMLEETQGEEPRLKPFVGMRCGASELELEDCFSWMLKPLARHSPCVLSAFLQCAGSPGVGTVPCCEH